MTGPFPTEVSVTRAFTDTGGERVTYAADFPAARPIEVARLELTTEFDTDGRILPLTSTVTAMHGGGLESRMRAVDPEQHFPFTSISRRDWDGPIRSLPREYRILLRDRAARGLTILAAQEYADAGRPSLNDLSGDPSAEVVPAPLLLVADGAMLLRAATTGYTYTSPVEVVRV